MYEPTAGELGSLIAAAQKLWELDENRLKPGVDYLLNVQVSIPTNLSMLSTVRVALSLHM